MRSPPLWGLLVLPALSFSLPANAEICGGPVCDGYADSCQADACEAVEQWTSELRRSSVQLAWQKQNGEWRNCSGALINDGTASNKLNVVTVGNCFDENLDNNVSAAERSRAETTLIAYFDRVTTPCGDAQSISAEFSRSGGEILAIQTAQTYWYAGDLMPGDYSPVSYPDLDFALVRVTGSPPPGANVRFAGWDITTHSNMGLAMVHHPLGDSAKIAVMQHSLGYGTQYLSVQGWEHGGPTYGSWGAGLYTVSGLLRGVFWGFWDENAQFPSVDDFCEDNTNARTFFSDFEAIHPHIAAHVGNVDSTPPRWFLFCENDEGVLDYPIPAGDVLHVAGCDEVRLKPGFHAASGSDVRVSVP